MISAKISGNLRFMLYKPLWLNILKTSLRFLCLNFIVDSVNLYVSSIGEKNLSGSIMLIIQDPLENGVSDSSCRSITMKYMWLLPQQNNFNVRGQRKLVNFYGEKKT